MKRLAYLALIALIACTSPVQPGDGRVTFGTSLDTTTFVLSGEGTRFPKGTDVAFLASFSRVMEKGQIRLSAKLRDVTVLDQLVDITETATAYGGTLPASLFYDWGPVTFRVLDVGNVELASGTMTVAP